MNSNCKIFQYHVQMKNSFTTMTFTWSYNSNFTILLFPSEKSERDVNRAEQIKSTLYIEIA